MDKQINSNGQKSYQRSDNEDRSLVYRKWLRTVEVDGYFIDIDLVKFRGGTPCAITELSRCDNESVPGEEYFKAIVNRWYIRDGQASLIETVSKKLGVPAYLVIFGKDLNWFVVWDFQDWTWSKPMEPQEYTNWLSKL